ncbi:hypothetical protein NCC49_000069 [Naganishia albida]|nr:hypothetical protein NCC49_000069 [Naganishia albida]
MSDTEQQAKATTPEDVVMEEEDAPAAKDEDVVPATDEEPAAAEPESKETEKPAAKEKPASSKSKSKAGQSSRKDSGTSARKIGGKFAKADAKASNKGKYNFGDICLGRVKGFPFWPCYVVDPETVTPDVARQRPKSSSITCVQYFPTAEYSWLSPNDIKPLPKHEIDAYLKSTTKKTDGKLYAAYGLAADPEEFISEQNELRQHGGVVDEAEDEDQLAEDDEEDEEPEAKSGNKRKKIPADQKPAKKEPASKKAKTEKAPSKRATKKETAAEEGDEPVSKKASTSKAAANKKAPASSGKKAAAPTSAAKETKDAKEDAGDDALANDPEATKVRDWRHKLQRAFLSKSVPSAEEMDNYDKLFTTIENYQNMTVAYLAHSKIGKVMKKIAALTNIPRNDDLKITDRAHALMQKWTDQIDGKSAETVGNGDVATDSKAAESTEDKKTEDAAAAEEVPAEDKMEVDEKQNADATADKEAAPVDA